MPLDSPYLADREIVWAVAPLANASGVSTVDTLLIADRLVNTLRESRGVTARPVNDTIAAMRALRMPTVATAGDAIALAVALDADALIIGTVTSWDPYNPPELGITISLFGRNETMQLDPLAFDPRPLQGATSDTDFRRGTGTAGALTTVALHLDASNESVRRDIRRFAEGRHDPDSALGWEGFVESMERFEQYACYRAVSELYARERVRLARLAQQQSARP